MAILIILSLKGEEIWTLLGASRHIPPFELKVIKIAIHNSQLRSADFSTLFDVFYVCLLQKRFRQVALE